MQCVLCGGATVPRLVATDVAHRGRTFIISDVPADVCTGCNEPYFELATHDDLAAEAAERWARLREVG